MNNKEHLKYYLESLQNYDLYILFTILTYYGSVPKTTKPTLFHKLKKTQKNIELNSKKWGIGNHFADFDYLKIKWYFLFGYP